MSVLKKGFDKSVAGSDLSSRWAFLKRGTKVSPHRYSAKEIYFFIKDEGFVQIGQESPLVKAGEAVYIPPNIIHEIWNEKEEWDLSAIIIREEFRREGVNFMTSNASPMRVAVSSYEVGPSVKPHFSARDR